MNQTVKRFLFATKADVPLRILRNMYLKTKNSLVFYKNYLSFVSDYKNFKSMSAQYPKRFPMQWKYRYACLYDKKEKSTLSIYDKHYIYHTGWAARILKKTNPEFHVDISSSMYFVSIASAIVPIKFYEYRPATLELSNIDCGAEDLCALSFPDQSVKSLSCMHVVEHVGLGRYGDKINPQGDLKAIAELQRVLAKDGELLFVVPLGKPKITFNAERIYSYEQILSYFPELVLKEFALIPDNPDDGEILYNPPQKIIDKQRLACGCFWFTRK